MHASSSPRTRGSPAPHRLHAAAPSRCRQKRQGAIRQRARAFRDRPPAAAAASTRNSAPAARPACRPPRHPASTRRAGTTDRPRPLPAPTRQAAPRSSDVSSAGAESPSTPSSGRDAIQRRSHRLGVIRARPARAVPSRSRRRGPRVIGSSAPTNRERCRRAPFATPRFLPRSRVRNTTMRSASPSL